MYIVHITITQYYVTINDFLDVYMQPSITHATPTSNIM